MENERELGLIVVGCGKWGINLIKTAHTMGRLVAVVDASEQSLNSLAQRHPQVSNIPTYIKLSAALEAHKNAAIIVATPPKTHFPVAMEALQGNRHVFVEKPICDSISDARTLVSVAKTRGLTLMVDHLLQYSLPHRRLIHLVSTGYVGNVTRVRMSRVNFGTIRTVEDVLWSFCPHDISILLALLRGGKKKNGQEIYATSVTCHGQAVVSSDITDYVDICVTFSSGSRAHVEASWLHPMKERRVIVYGSDGSIVLNEDMPDTSLPKLQAYKWSTKRRHDGSAVDIEKSDDDLAAHLEAHPEKDAVSFSSENQPLSSALNYFVHCVHTGVTPWRSDGKEALSVLALLDAAAESLRQGGISISIAPEGGMTQLSMNGAGKTANSVLKSKTFVHETAIVDSGAKIGQGTKIWHFSHVMSGASIGKNCNIGQNVYVGNTTLGNNVKVQNNVSIYDAVRVDDDVFLGPSCVLTNVKTPRAHVSRKHMFSSTWLQKGVTIGANATIVCGTTLGEFCFIGAGAVVTKDVLPHALVYGNPATMQGWVSKTGVKLVRDPVPLGNGSIKLQCPESGEVYALLESSKDAVLKGPL